MKLFAFTFRCLLLNSLIRHTRPSHHQERGVAERHCLLQTPLMSQIAYWELVHLAYIRWRFALINATTFAVLECRLFYVHLESKRPCPVGAERVDGMYRTVVRLESLASPCLESTRAPWEPFPSLPTHSRKQVVVQEESAVRTEIPLLLCIDPPCVRVCAMTSRRT